MPHRSYKRNQPRHLINATDAVNATNIQPKHSLKQYKCCKCHKTVEPQCPMKNYKNNSKRTLKKTNTSSCTLTRKQTLKYKENYKIVIVLVTITTKYWKECGCLVYLSRGLYCGQPVPRLLSKTLY